MLRIKIRNQSDDTTCGFTSLHAVYKYYGDDISLKKVISQVARLIQELIIKGEKIVHISVHTFTPVLKNKIRNTEIGILYDPKRKKKNSHLYLRTN